ncbi:MAG: diaminopimelate decarboxylase [Actinobacteria bacterium]|nr:diaminopimelate decarboxylase [Actinomycetota bacterium]
MLELLPASAAIEDGRLHLGGIAAASLAAEYGTPLLVLCEQTALAQARAYRRAAPEALIAYGTKALPNVALLRLLAREGLGADVSTLGELRFALQAGVPPERLVVHGNNKSDEELRGAAEAGAGLLVLDALEEVDRARAAGIGRVLVRVTSGIEADTHEAIRTSQHGSKFGLPADEAVEGIARARAAGLEVAGLHVHIGSQLLETQAAATTVEWLAAFAARCRLELDGWTPDVVDLGGGLGVRHVDDERPPAAERFVAELVRDLERAWSLHDLPRPRLVLEPGRSLVGRAGVTLYRVGVVKRATESVTYVTVDGGMSDNPRPQLYGARYAALLADRADEPPAGRYSVAGKHCEADTLIAEVELPAPRRGDLLAVPATGAYTLSMSSNYNALPRPAAVLVADGAARVIRRRETLDDLLALEVGADASG